MSSESNALNWYIIIIILPSLEFGLSHRILAFSSLSLAVTLFLIRSQQRSPYIIKQASERALATRALLLGTMASCAGVGLLTGSIGTLMNVHSMLDFRLAVESKIKSNSID
jgi:hypothetical protein